MVATLGRWHQAPLGSRARRQGALQGESILETVSGVLGKAALDDRVQLQRQIVAVSS